MSVEQCDAKSIFLAAAEKPVPERAAFLDQACGANVALRQRVEELLQAHEEPNSFIASAVPARQGLATIDEPITERPGTAIGPYKLLEQIGEGGFGVVFLAEQTEPVRRKVALKVLKPGMDTRQVVARFEAERQALAIMDHPNIAKVHDGGATASGRPYFVMELVQGVPITRCCDEHLFTLQQRLDLFVRACEAVQHAHQKGVIHRDLKPSNVLVGDRDDKPVLKVIDFGVAKAMGQQLTEKTLFTGASQMIGTPLYMSPEQAGGNGVDVDTRSDIYSLGVLLYELLTGTTPIDKERLQKAGYDEIRRIIREEEPPKPSTRMRKDESKRVGRSWFWSSSSFVPHPSSLQELDWIVMKALEKDRNRRYETANGFAMDVQRYLADEPVLACPPSVGYRLRKFVRRNKGPVLAATLVLLALVVGVIGTSWGLIRAEQHRLIVERQRNELAEHNQALQAAHEHERVLNERARQAIETVTSETAIEQLTRERELRPEQKEFLDKMIRYYEESTQAAAATEQERLRQARAYHNMGRMNQILGRSQDSETAYRRAIPLHKRLAADLPSRPERHQWLATTHFNLGYLLRDNGRLTEAEAAYGEALAIRKQLAANFPAVPLYRQDLSMSYNNLGVLFTDLGKGAEAESAYRQALAIFDKLAAAYPAVPRYCQQLAGSYHNLAIVLADLGKHAEAESAYRQALAIFDKLAADFPTVPQYRIELGNSQGSFANLLRASNQPEQALPWSDRAIATLEEALRQVKVDVTAHESLRRAHWGRAQALNALKRHAEAVLEWDKLIELSPGAQRAGLRLQRAASRVQAGQVDTAVKEAEELTKNADAGTLYDAACVLALAAARRDEAGGSLSKEECANRAIALLRQAVAKGFNDGEHMKKDDDLKALRPRDDFKKLVAELEGKK